jgi:peptide-methionine (S)-S-oxide reductase
VNSEATGPVPLGPGPVKATFGAGCFWGVEKIYAKLNGVQTTSVGYIGGASVNPSYEDICTGRTGHAEAVQITFDPQVISYGELVSTFFQWHDPTTLNQQGPDCGSQYRSAIFYHNEAQKEYAHKAVDLLNATNIYQAPITTQIEAAPEFYLAEDYHQAYLVKNPMGYCSHRLQYPKVAQILP